METKTILTTFAVDAVARATEPLKTVPYQKALHRRIVAKANESALLQIEDKARGRRRLEQYGDPEPFPFRWLESWSATGGELVAGRMHPFVDAVHTAYAQHYPLVLSPDMIWLLIAQGFAVHVNQNAEALRREFVNFSGTKSLVVRRDNFVKGDPGNDWESVFPEFCRQIGQETGEELVELIDASFSTSTIVEKTAFRITLMHSMKSYFRYTLMTLCGIPEISLEGSAEDWRQILKKAKALERYGLGWWVEKLLPVLEGFCEAAEGRVDVKFWRSLYKWHNPGSGNSHITGWITHFFPYLKYGAEYRKNPVMVSKSTAWGFMKQRSRPKITSENFPSGVAEVDFTWKYYQEVCRMMFAAGFVGFRQATDTLALRPEIGWAVVEKAEGNDFACFERK